MKRFGVLLAGILIMESGPLLSQEKTPVMTFENTTKDFGKVTEGETLKHVFKFTNKGKGVLEILNVEAACGCTAVAPPAKKVPAGQASQIEVSVKTEGLTTLNKTVTVTSNDPRQPQVILNLIAEIEPEFKLSDRSVYFGSVPRGKEVVREIFITVPSGKSSKLLSAESTDQNVTAKLSPVSDSGGKKYKVLAVQKPDAKDGYHFGAIVIKTSSLLTPELKIPVRGMVIAPPSK